MKNLHELFNTVVAEWLIHDYPHSQRNENKKIIQFLFVWACDELFLMHGALCLCDKLLQIGFRYSGLFI